MSSTGLVGTVSGEWWFSVLSYLDMSYLTWICPILPGYASCHTRAAVLVDAGKGQRSAWRMRTETIILQG